MNSLLKSSGAIMLLCILTCGASQTILWNPYASYTPKIYRENRIFVLDSRYAIDNSKQQGLSGLTPADQYHRKLIAEIESLERKKKDVSDLWLETVIAAGKATGDRKNELEKKAKLYSVEKQRVIDELKNRRNEIIAHGSPLSIIVNEVGIPNDENLRKNAGSKGMDIAVIVDIYTSTSQNKSLVVWYQRGVMPGQTLNFANLLVYFEPYWDSRYAPYFRLRIIDFRDQKNVETQEMLNRVSNLGVALGKVVPDPTFTPIVKTAAAAAELVLGNDANITLLDYTVQFFSQETIRQSGNSSLGALRRGSFLVTCSLNSDPS